MDSKRKVKSCCRMVNFDLDTRAMKDLGVYPQGYVQMQSAFEKQGFAHRQGSGYVTLQEVTDFQFEKLLREVVLCCPWLETAMKRIDVTEVGDMYNMDKFVLTTLVSARKKREREARSEQSALTEDDKRVIERIQKSVMRDEYNTLMSKPTLTETEAQKLMHTVEYFSKLGARKSDGDVAEQMTRILASSRAYDGNASGLRNRIDGYIARPKSVPTFARSTSSRENGRGR